MVKPIVSALALSLVLTGCGMFGGDNPAPAPVVQAAPEPTPPPPPPPPPPLTHSVKKGETIAALAKKYSVPATQLMAANNLPNAKALRAGMTLVIPGKVSDAPKPKPVAEANLAQVESKTVDPKGAKAGKGKKSDPYGVEAAVAPEKGKKKPGKVDDEATYEKIKVEFHEYARKWLEKSANLSQTTKSHKDVKMEDGRYVASYSVILINTMGTEVKRVDYDDTPYVGHITYQLEGHRTFGPTAQAASSSSEEEVKQESMREIFSYSGKKRAWR